MTTVRRRLTRWFMTSLRRRLLLWLLPVTFLAGVIASLGSYWGAMSQLGDLLNDQMRYIAEHVSVKGDGSVSFSGDRVQKKSRLNLDAADEVVLQVWHNGKLDYTTDTNLAFPEPKRSGVHQINVGGHTWHSYVSKRGERWVLVAQARDARFEALAVVAVHLFWPVVSLIPLLALFIWFGIGYGLKPLRNISTELAERNVNSMDPFDTRSLPSEVVPFVKALNDLLQRLEQAIRMQQDFVADAAHELRTPIMGLMIQTQLLQRTDSEEERQANLQQLQVGIDRLSHLSRQLLALARLDPHPDTTSKTVELSALCKSVISDLIRVAEAKQIDLGLVGTDTATVQGDPDNLRILLTNLVDNAIRYTGSGGHVDLSVRRTPKGIVLGVCDDGPGIPEEERERVLERFYRGGSGANAPGSGLGLSIVKRIADRQGAILTLTTGQSGRGLNVQVRFPSVVASLPLSTPSESSDRGT